MFRERLKLLRKREGLTQETLAQILGVERSTIGKYEGRGQVMPSAEVLQTLADHFRVSIDYLLGRTNDPTDYNTPAHHAGLRGEGADSERRDAEAGPGHEKRTGKAPADEKGPGQEPELFIPEDLMDLALAFHRGGVERLTQDEINKLVEIAKIIKKESDSRNQA